MAERVAKAEERKAELAALPVPPMGAVDEMSLADLKQVIEQGGLESADCVEKAELRERAKEAIVALGGSAEADDDDSEGGEGDDDDDDGGDEAQAQAQAQALAEAQAARASQAAGEPNDAGDGRGAVDISDDAGGGAGGGAGGAPDAPGAAPVSPEAAAQAELQAWSAVALQHQLGAMSESFPPDATQDELSSLLWAALGKAGKQQDEVARRFLITVDGTDNVALCRLWISAVTGMHFPPEYNDLQALLRSGEVLCDLINKLRPGIVGSITRYAEAAAMPDSKRNAKMRENVGQYVDACAELGLPQRELFITADLFDNKDFRAVLRNIEGLARYAQENVPGFHGPHVGKKALVHKKKFAVHTVQAPQVILGGGRGGAYIPAVGGRGM